MLPSFVARNFRLFANLEIPRLSQINLFVGRNNAGKSALLEAVEVYASNASLPTLLDIVSARAETWDSSPHWETGFPPAVEMFRHLFKGHQLPVPGELGLIVGPLQQEVEQIQLTIAAYQTIEQAGLLQRRLLTPAQYQELAETDPTVSPELVAIEAGRSRRVGGVATRSPHLTVRNGNEARLPLQVVPTRNMLPTKVAALWDITDLTDIAANVIAGLRLVEPQVLDVAFVKAQGNLERIPLVKLAGQPSPLPLRSLGDGITRLFHIILALVNAQHGVLLVDEFENGLHWSVQESIWETVFKLAAQLNVQVFATTHSRDCIQAFQAAWERHQDQGTYYRLELDGQGEVKAQHYSLDTLADSIAADVETR